MFKILTLNNISPLGLARLPKDNFQVSADAKDPDAILLRSFKMHDMEIPKNLKAVGRAGAGVNNIPVEKLSKMGIPVFNAPGANANAVKELVLAGMLMAARNVAPALEFVRGLDPAASDLGRRVEDGKKQFAGFELPCRALGVIGLGAIGGFVADTATLALGAWSGTLTALRAGTFWLAARDTVTGFESARAQVVIGPAPPDHIALSPDTLALTAGVAAVILAWVGKRRRERFFSEIAQA